MSEAPSSFFTEVQRHLHEMDEPVDMNADERELVDDYENQEFGARQCAEQILKDRAKASK